MARQSKEKPARKSPQAKKPPGKVAAKRQTRSVAPEPRIGALTPEEFAAIGREALGGHGWQKTLATGCGLAQSTLTRYMNGAIPIPQHIAVIMEMIQTLRGHGLPLPDAFADPKSLI